MTSRNLWPLLGVCVLLALVGAGSAWAQASAPVTSTRAHATLQQVLARPEFIIYDGSGKPSQSDSALMRWLREAGKKIGNFYTAHIKEPLARFGHALARFFERLFARFAPKEPTTEGPSKWAWFFTALNWLWVKLYAVRYILLGVIVLVLLGLALHALLARQQRRQITDTLDAVAASPTARRKHEPSFWERSLAEAEALWQQGDEREAVRVLYRACLVLLDARSVLRYDESRANGEVLRELRRQGKSHVQQSLTPIVRGFDRSWYGFLRLSGEEFTIMVENSRRFREAVVEGHDG
ncbi:MAG TPA: DUF4129 domain-containing protein [Armatimonadota bacterium]|jgi:hypothetical protein